MHDARNRMNAHAREKPAGNHLVRLLSHGSSLPPRRRFALYLGIATVLLASIWGPVGLFLMFKPTSFTSTWALILPGSGTGHAVSLDSVGQANATVSSPYTSHSVDPKVNYKAIATSDPVLAAAAASLGMTQGAFGKPRIKLVDQTAMINFRVSGGSPELARDKSRALYRALQAELERLRSDELARRETGIRDMLSGFSDKLRDAQQRILDYQAQAQIVSMQQFNELTLGLERLRAQVRDLKARRAGLEGQIAALRESLKTGPQEAIAMLDLQQDPLFRELAQHWADASARLVSHRTRWGRNHQKVVDVREEERDLRKALFQRAASLAPALEQNTTRLVAQGHAEPELYRHLIERHAERAGLENEIVSLEQAILTQEAQLERGTTDASNLEDLKRRHQVATAVFTTALAKVDIGKSDRFSSYPLVQLLAKPTLPEKADTLGRNLALLGAGAGSLFTLLGLTLLWIRKPFFRKILKNA